MIRFGQRLATVVAASFIVAAVVAAPVVAKPPSWSHSDAQVCGKPGAGQARCMSIARTFYLDGHVYQAGTVADLGAVPETAQTTWFHGPDLRTAYGIPTQMKGDPSKVVAIVDAYDDRNAFSNLTRFRTDQALPTMQSCSLGTLTSLGTSGDPCFTKVNQTGGTSLPRANAGWSNEIDLDLQAVSSICPDCSILLLEATSASVLNLATAATTASKTAHVLAISNSYGISGDYPGSVVPAYDNAASKGIAVTASAGDGGYGVLFPASATNVLGVGGTTLTVDDTTHLRTTEAAWAGTGSGCSVYNTAPTWQSITPDPCNGMKAVSTLSADADPNSGLAVYTTYSGITGYWVFGGTSLSSPLIAALYTMQGGYGGSTLAGQYAWAPTTPYYDVTSGTNGTCGSPLCKAGSGWDGPTGRGSIAMTSVTPPPPPTASFTASPTSGTATLTVDFTDTSQGSPTSWSWTFGDGGTSTAQNPSHPYTSAGTYTVSLTATNAGGSDTVTKSGLITVTDPPPPTASFTASPTSGTAPLTVAFTDGSSGSPTSWSWDFGDQATSTLQNPTHTYTTPGTYTVSLTATNAGGSDTVTQADLISVGAPTADFTLSVSPTSRSVRHGSSTTYSVAVTWSSGTGSVSLSVAGLPSGATGTFDPTSITGTGTATLTISTSSSVARGTYALTITGTSGQLVHTVSASLRVR